VPASSLMHTLSVFIPSSLLPLSIFSPLRFGFNLLFPIENSPSGRPHCQRNQQDQTRRKEQAKGDSGHIMQSDYFFFLPRLRPLFRPETCNLALSRVILLPSLGRAHLLATVSCLQPACSCPYLNGWYLHRFLFSVSLVSAIRHR